MALAARRIGPRVTGRATGPTGDVLVGTIVVPTGIPGEQGVNQPPLTWGSISGTITNQPDLVTYIEEQPAVRVLAAAPASPANGTLWFDTANGRLMLYHNNWIQIA